MSHPIGIFIPTPNPEALRQRLYRAKRAASDPALSPLQFRLVELDNTPGVAVCHPTSEPLPSE